MTMLTAADECTDCTGGYYCETPGLTEPTGPCDAGKLLFLYLTTALLRMNLLYVDSIT